MERWYEQKDHISRSTWEVFVVFLFCASHRQKLVAFFFLLYKRSPKSHSRAKPRPLKITYYVTTPFNFSGKLQEKFSWILLILELSKLLKPEFWLLLSKSWIYMKIRYSKRRNSDLTRGCIVHWINSFSYFILFIALQGRKKNFMVGIVQEFS